MGELRQQRTLGVSKPLLFIAVVLFSGSLWFDLGSKAWATQNLSARRYGSPVPRCAPDELGMIQMQRVRGKAVVLIEDYLELRYAENCGAAFSLLRDASPNVRRVVFGFASVLAAVTLVWIFIQSKKNARLVLGLALIASGAIGNIVDRVRYEYVVDFIRFHIRNQWEWPTFNIADAAITMGVALLLLDGLFQRRETRPAQTAPEKV